SENSHEPRPGLQSPTRPTEGRTGPASRGDRGSDVASLLAPAHSQRGMAAAPGSPGGGDPKGRGEKGWSGARRGRALPQAGQVREAVDRADRRATRSLRKSPHRPYREERGASPPRSLPRDLLP